MTKDEFILYQTILIKKQLDWRVSLFASLGKNSKFLSYLCDKHPFLKFPCGFNTDRMLGEACIALKIGTVHTPIHELWKLAEEYHENIADKTSPNSKAFRDAIEEANKQIGEL